MTKDFQRVVAAILAAQPGEKMVLVHTEFWADVRAQIPDAPIPPDGLRIGGVRIHPSQEMPNYDTFAIRHGDRPSETFRA